MQATTGKAGASGVDITSLPGFPGTAADLVDGTASATDTSNTSVIAAQGSGNRIYVTTLILSNSSDTDVEVTIKSATTARLVVPVPAGGGCVVPLPVPLRLGDNEALQFASSASASTVHCSAVGFTAA